MTSKFPTNHPLRHAVAEFELADIVYREMVRIGVGNFHEYQKSWKEFLHRIDRVWSKLQAAVHNMSGWDKIESEFTELRKKDPLLQYLHQARNAEQHSIADLGKDWEPEFKAEAKGGYIELSWQPWDRPLLPITNRGRIYEPPKSHLGESIEHLKGQGKAEPRVVAGLAMRFYCDLLNRVSVEIVGSKRDF